MKPASFLSKFTAGTLALAMFALQAPVAKADPAEAADRAFEMAMKYSAAGYYMSPTKEGHGGFGVTLEFEIPVARGLDYVFILAGDRYCEDVDVWVEAEETGNTIVKDTRRVSNGLAGVRWRSDYNGNVVVVVHFARVTSRCGWCALVGRRGTPIAEPGAGGPGSGSFQTGPGAPMRTPSATPGTTGAVTQ